MSGCFVRLLFGDDLVDRRDAIMREVALCRRLPQPEPLVFWAMGRENLRIAREAGWDAQLLYEEPVLNFTGATERHPERLFGGVPYGTNMFHAKFVAMAETIRLGYDHAVFLDLDVSSAMAIPSDFWERLENGREVQTPLKTYCNLRCCWRKDGRRTICFAAAFYIRGTEMCDRLLRAAREHPEWYEQQIMSWVTDEMLGGWTDAYTFRDAGFWFPYLDAKLSLPAEVPVFRIMLSKGHSPMIKNPAAWEAYIAAKSWAVQ